MLESLFSELEDLLWGLGIVSFAIIGLLVLPKNISNKLGQYPLILTIMRNRQHKSMVNDLMDYPHHLVH